MGLKLLPQKNRKRWAITDRMFLSLFMTGAIIEFSHGSAGLIDGLIISRFLGENAMAAEGIVHPFFSITGLFSGLLAVGMQVRCARAIGRGNRKEYNRFVSAAVCVGAVIALIIAALVLCFSKPVVVLLGASGNAAELAEPAAQYLKGIGFGIPALIMTAILSPALQLDSGRALIRRGALLDAVSNVLMDIAAVKLGWGMFGIGLATTVASYLNLFCQCSFFLKKDRVLHLVRPDVPFKEFMHMIADGSDMAVRRLSTTVRPIILNAIIISYGGATAMSVLSVRNSLSNFVDIFAVGVASAVSLLSGVYYGKINAEAIEEVGAAAHRQTVIVTSTICVLLAVFARPIASVYFAEGRETLDMAAFVIRMLALQNPLQVLIRSRIKYLQAIRKQHSANILTAVTQVVFVLLSAFVLGRLFGVYGILACYTVSDALTLAAIYIYHSILARKGLPSVRNYLSLPDEFFLKPGDEIALDIRSCEDVSLCSEQIMLFGKGHKIDRRTSYFAALAFEELATRTIKEGFPKNKSNDPMIDLRVVISGGYFVIRMRDNCPQFDATQQIAEANGEESDPMRNIGVRVVSRTATEIICLRTFDTNNIILRFKLNE